MTPTLPDNWIPAEHFRPISADDRNEDKIQRDPKDCEPTLLVRVNKFYFKNKENK